MVVHWYFSPGPYGQWFAAVVAGLAVMTGGIGYGWPNAALPKLLDNTAGFQITSFETSIMVTVVFVANMVSPIPGGYIMDLIGRKWTLMLFSFTSIASWAIVIFVKSAVGLYVARGLAGIWTGVIYTVVPVYLGEVMEPSNRGSASSLMASFLFVGCLYEVVLGPAMSYQMLAVASIVPPVVLLLALVVVPESPYYYLIKNDTASAEQSLKWLRGNTDVTEDMQRMETAVKQQLESKSSFADIFRTSASRKAFFLVAILGCVQRSSGLTLLFTYASVSIPDSFVSTSTSVIILNVVWLVTGIVGMRCLDRFGRKTMFLISCAGAFLTMLLVTAWFYLRDITKANVSSTQWIPFVVLVINGIVYSLGLVSVPGTVQGEMLSVNVKAKSSAITSMLMAMVSGLVVLIYLPITENIGVYLNYAICAVATFIGAVFATFFLFETKGKTLEDIQTILATKR